MDPMNSVFSNTSSVMTLTHPSNPSRPADWRWERARFLREKSRLARLSRDDDFVRIARLFQIEKAKVVTDHDTERLMDKFHGIYWANDIYSKPTSAVRWIIEAMLVACMPAGEIAELCKTDADVITWYEKLFFNVLPHLRQEAWIINIVMGASVHSGVTEREHDLLWKMIGYGLGPVFLMDFFRPIKTQKVSIEQIDSAYDSWIRNQMHKRMAVATQTIPIYDNHEIIFNAWNKIREIDKADGLGAAGEITIVQNVQAAMNSLPFTVGRDMPLELLGVKKYHDAGVELRPNEQLQLTSGQIEELVIWKFPSAPAPAATGTEQAAG